MQRQIRNVAVIAHVDHGKPRWWISSSPERMFRENQAVAERMMDSMDLERERGITIAAKNGALRYRGHTINIIDTPGHADFGGQVERVLQMADGALLLVDAQEGPMPQTFFVLKKALALRLPIIVVVNKIDKPAARPNWAVDQVFDLFVKLDAPHEILDFHVLYASAIGGYAGEDPSQPGTDMQPLFDAIIKYIPAPSGDAQGPLQMRVSTIDHSPFLGRLGIGKITSGSMWVGMPVAVADSAGQLRLTRITKIYRFDCTRKVEVDSAGLGEIVAVAGQDDLAVGETFTDPEDPRPLPSPPIDPPTVSMFFCRITRRLQVWKGNSLLPLIWPNACNGRLCDVALVVEELPGSPGFKVSGRGELHLSVIIEKMRREGYEFQVSCPRVIFKEENGRRLEPYEELLVEMAEEHSGTVIEKLGARKGQLLEMRSENGLMRMRYRIPTRGLLGFKSEFMSDVKGMGALTYVFLEYGEFAGEMRQRRNGALVSTENCTTVAYALFNLQKRGRLFLEPGVRIYRGQIIGEHCRDNDLMVNPSKGKHLTNVRASGSDENIILTPVVQMSLEDCITYINDDELVEITPQNIRLRKR